jgi:predicted amino acid racemase
MVELGDLREGILPCNLAHFIKEALTLTHIKIVGLGSNLACCGGVRPDNNNMNKLSELVRLIENEFKIHLDIISGGNSANYEWSQSVEDVGRINNLRLGESIFLGNETLNRTAIPGLHTSAFQLVAEVIESKVKPSLPFGKICQDAFGNTPNFSDKGSQQRAIVALGRQDVLVSSLKSTCQLDILGSSSDHIILDSKNNNLKVGDEVNFDLDYGGLLAAMTSPFIKKEFVIRPSLHDRLAIEVSKRKPLN